MKRFMLVFLSILTALTLLPMSAGAVFAEEKNTIDTNIFLPTSYLQYYKLDNPYAICRYEDEDGKEVVAISHKNGIVIYRDERFKTIDLDLGNAQIKKIDHYGKYLVYFFGLRLYSVDMTDFNGDGWNAEERKEKIRDNVWDFSIFGDKIVIATDSYFSVYPIAINDNGLSISAEDDYEYRVNADKPSNILFADGAVYYTNLGNNVIKYTKVGEEQKQEQVATVTNVQALAKGEDGEIYYSCQNGVFTLSGETIKETSDITETDKDLGKIYDPKGICLTDKGLWVVDGTINAVQEIDLTDNSFTKFAITTNSNAINRLSEKVKDLCVDKDKIYALDSGRIVVINDIDGVNTYNRIDVSADLFAVGDGNLLTYVKSTEKLCLYDIKDNGGENLEKQEKTAYERKNVKDICYADGKFYVLYEEYVDTVVYPVISVFASSDDLPSLPKGYALQITADVFGNVYYATETQTGDDGNYEFYKVGDTTPIITVEKTKKLINLQTDLDGKLYALYESNYVECYENSETLFNKEVKLSSNLDSVNEIEPLTAKSMCLSYNSPTAYFLFNGLILKSSNAEEMNISTPERIKAGEGFSVKYDENNEFCGVKIGANLFEVDKDLSNGFNFLGIEKEAEETDYVKFDINDRYSLVICKGKNYIARKSDLVSIRGAEDKDEFGYAAVGFKVYSIPVTEEYYASAGASSHEKIEILSSLEFNGESYYAVKTAGGEGYIPTSFIISTLAEENEFESARSTYIFIKGGVTVWANEDRSEELKTVEKKTKVKVIGISGKILKIDLGGEIGYVDSSAEYSDDRNNTVKAIAVILCALSITAFALFFEGRLYRKKR